MVRNYRFFAVMAVSAFLLAAPLAFGQAFLTPGGPLVHNPNVAEHCQGGVRLVGDVGVEGRRTTPWNFAAVGGGGESGRFDPTPVLQTKVQLNQGCLNAHFSAIVGSQATYGAAFAPTTLFQVTLSYVDPITGLIGPPQHLYGHWETPYGAYGPAVAIGAERDVDTFGANFFGRIGTASGEFIPGTYIVDVWWAGGNPAIGGGAIGAAFVLKLYQE
jgi:hypothetical protein